MTKLQLTKGSVIGFYVAVLFIVLIVLPRDIASIILLLLFIGALVVGLWQPIGQLLTRWRGRIRRRVAVVMLVAVGLSVLAAVMFRPGNFAQGGFGIAVFVAVLVLVGTLPPEISPAMPDYLRYDSKPRPNRLLLGLSVILMGGVTAVNISLMTLPTWIQIALFTASLSLFVATFGVPHPRWNSQIIGVVLLIVLAFFLRVIHLGTSVDRYVDELHSIIAVANLWENPNTPFLTHYSTVTAFTWTFPVMQNVSVAILGDDLLGLRMVSAIMGAVNVAALWWLAKILFGGRVAWVAALALAVFPPHIHFSRLGLNNIADPLVGTLAFAFAARAMVQDKDRSDFNFATAGVLLGCTQLFYEGGRLVYPPVMLAWMGMWWLQSRRAFPWRGALILLGGFLLIAIPVYWTFISQDLRLVPRLQINVKNGEYWVRLFEDGGGFAIVNDLVRGVRDALWMLVQHPDISWFYNGQSGTVIPWMLPFFLLGVTFALWRLSKPGFFLLFLWIIAVVSGNSLLIHRFEAPRYVVAHPALVLLVAVGIVYTAHLLRRGVLVPLLAVFIAVSGISYYFHVQLVHFNEAYPASRMNDNALLRLSQLPTPVTAFFVKEGGLYIYDITMLLRYYGHEEGDVIFSYVHEDEMTEAFMDRLPEDRYIAFFVHPDMSNAFESLNQLVDPQYNDDIDLPYQQQYALFLLERAP